MPDATTVSDAEYLRAITFLVFMIWIAVVLK